MKIYDTFMFFNELDLLELRMEILNEHVDYFVINEATTTFSGSPKPLYFDDNRDRYKKFKKKIIHHVFSESKPEWNEWDRDRLQKESITETLRSCKSDDVIFYSDADEIPNFKKINFPIENYRLYICQQDCYYYYFNTLWENLMPGNSFWGGTKFSTWDMLRKNSIDEFRNSKSDWRKHNKDKTTFIPKCGWHFSFLGGKEKIKLKIQSYAHTEMNIPLVIDNIQDNIDKLRDPFFRMNMRITPVRMTDETHPSYLMENLHKYNEYIYGWK